MRLFGRAKDRHTGGGPVADAQIHHPGLIGSDYLPILMAPDPAGLLARMGTHFLPVEYIGAQQHSPVTNWNPGSPYPGPPAHVNVPIDIDSMRWWGRTGQGQLVWSDAVHFTADLPPAIPQDMVQHVDNWSYFMGGYPSMARNRPSAFGDQVPVLNP